MKCSRLADSNLRCQNFTATCIRSSNIMHFGQRFFFGPISFYPFLFTSLKPISQKEGCIYRPIYTHMHADVSLVRHSVDRKFQCCVESWPGSAQLSCLSIMYPITYSCHHILLIHTDLHAGSCQERLCLCNICVYMRGSVTGCEQNVCIHACTPKNTLSV